jgi:hypothetical protein
MTPLDHQALLTLVHKAEAAATDGEVERLEGAAGRLLAAVLDHVDAERLELGRLAPGEGARLRDGQERIVELLAELVSSARASRPGRCRWIAERVGAELSLQADEERLAGLGARRAGHRST